MSCLRYDQCGFEGYLGNVGLMYNDKMSATPETHPQRLCRKLRQFGALHSAQIFIRNIFPKFALQASTAFIVGGDIRDWPRDQAPDPDIRWATEEDGELFEQTGGMSEADLFGYLARHAQIAICERDGKLICYFIYETGDIYHYPWIRYRMAPGDVWNSMVWTAPQNRGKGVFAQVLYFALTDLCRQGFKRRVASIDATNVSSLRATIKNIGILGSVTFVRFFGLTAIWVNGRVTFGGWRDGKPLELKSDLFQVIPTRPYGPVDAKYFERLINK